MHSGVKAIGHDAVEDKVIGNSAVGDKAVLDMRLRILRRKSPHDKPYWQEIDYHIQDFRATVASALAEINEAGDYRDAKGRIVEPIRWECSCLQKKCGACAMIIDGRPRLACDSRLMDYSRKKIIAIEPFRKFPVIADLIVDRSILYDNLRRLEAWSEEDMKVTDKNMEKTHEASRCLQCGCCLEVCPNFSFDGDFFGMAGVVPAARLLLNMSDRDRARVRKLYDGHIYAGCGKSLSCKNICPQKIDSEQMLVNSNAIAVWRRGNNKDSR